MATKARPRPSSSSAGQVPPEWTHPSQAAIQKALSSGDRAHAPSYHAFVSSPYHPAASSSSSSNGAKKRKSGAGEGIPPPVEGAVPVREVQQALLAWYDGVASDRGMPWRKEVDLKVMSREERSQRGYEVWVSEIMLQQTQVTTVIGYWTRWMEAFPTVAVLAKADIEEVNKLWTGLGYYSRASRLLAGAKTVVKKFGGLVPEEASQLLEVDGIGPYSAGAISSIAFGKREAMVDGNVQRVLSRFAAIHAPYTAKATTTYIWALASLLVPAFDDSDLAGGGHNKAGAFNQALMELGATVCTPKSPKCGECPLRETCLASAEVRLQRRRTKDETSPHFSKPSSKAQKDDDECDICTPLEDLEDFGRTVTIYPMAKERKKPTEEETAVCVLSWRPAGTKRPEDEMVLMVKRPEKGLLAGLYEFPAIDLPLPEGASGSARTALHSLLSSLIADTLPPTLKLPKAGTPSRPQAMAVVQSSSLESVTQVYSHQIRRYHPLVVTLQSPTLPALRGVPAPGNGKKAHPSTGRAKWVRATEVKSANMGGAGFKVWDVWCTSKKAKHLAAPAKEGKKSASPKKVAGKRKPKAVESSEEEEDSAEETDDSESEDSEPVASVKKRKLVKGSRGGEGHG